MNGHASFFVKTMELNLCSIKHIIQSGDTIKLYTKGIMDETIQRPATTVEKKDISFLDKSIKKNHILHNLLDEFNLTSLNVYKTLY